MNEERYPKQCYYMSRHLDDNNRVNWTTNIKNILFKFGFGEVWLSQNIGDPSYFMLVFKDRLTACATQDWHSAVTSSDKLTNYSEFKSLLDLELYLKVVPQKKYVQALARLRCSNHDLMIEKGRLLNVPKHERFCSYCRVNGLLLIETEYHFVMECKLYSDIRKDLIMKHMGDVNKYNFINLMRTKNVSTLQHLSHFVYLAFNLRREFLSNQ